MAYDEKYRECAVAFKNRGNTFKPLKEVFKISSSTYYKWVKNKEKTGFYVEPQTGKATRKRKIDPVKLKSAIEEKPDAYLRELAAKFNCSTTAIHNRCKQLKITYKKRHLPTRKKARKPGRNTVPN
jgi:transposase